MQKYILDPEDQYQIEESMKAEEEPFEYVVEEHVDEVMLNEDTEDTDGEGTKSQSSYVPASKRARLEEEPEETTTYSCELCPKTFGKILFLGNYLILLTKSLTDRKEYYRRHFRRVHTEFENKDEKPSIFQCDLCGKISTSNADHEAHQLEHDCEEARFKCRKCSQQFSTKEEARQHLTTAHTEKEKNFVCETCPKSFKNRYQLVLHNRSHTGEKPFQCPICERAFSMSSNLQKHLDTHSTDKPYQCVS
jgi:KRAB domain-containing zinc finger protein